MASGPITSWEIDGETVETVSDFIFLGSKITTDGACSHEIKRRLLLGRKVMTNLDSIFKSLKWFAIPFSSGPHSVRPLHHDPPILGGLTGHDLVSLSKSAIPPRSMTTMRNICIKPAKRSTCATPRQFRNRSRKNSARLRWNSSGFQAPRTFSAPI